MSSTAFFRRRIFWEELVMWSNRTSSDTFNDRRLLITFLGVMVAYCMVVLWYVATFPDAGLRCLLPDAQESGRGIVIQKYLDVDEGATDPAPRPGDRLLRLGGQEISTFLDFTRALANLRFAKIPPGGQLAPGSDPGELRVPPLVEIYSRDRALPAQRMVEIEYESESAGASSQTLVQRAYLPVRPITTGEISITLAWFVSQATILAFAIATYWYRPFDRISQTFCVMSCTALGAFVPGFHWWILTGHPALNIPFIVCACMLPGLALRFFLVFPRETEFVRRWRRFITLGIVIPSAVMTVLLVAIYWSAWSINGVNSSAPLTPLQKIAVLSRMLLPESAGGLIPATAAESILQSLRSLTEITMAIASIAFAVTVVCLGFSLMHSDTATEKRQVVPILTAALLSTIPIGYTLYLAFFRTVDFALGRGQFPMFLASMMFMSAYSHGILRDRLMLAEDGDERNRRYIAVSLLVSASFAVLIALGAMTANTWSLPFTSTTTQQISLFVILVLAAGIVIWVRDQLQAVVDRRFFSEKYQLDRAMQQLNRSAAYLTEPGAMAELTLRTCEDVIGASWSMMLLRDAADHFRLTGSRGPSQAPPALTVNDLSDDESESTIIPRLPAATRESMNRMQLLLHTTKAELICRLEGQDGLHGIILLGRKGSGVPYSAEDFAFLHAVAQMTTLALHSSRANQTLARLNAELQSRMESISEQQRQLAALRSELTILQQDAGQQPVVHQPTHLDREGLRGTSDALNEVLRQVGKVAATSSNVLIRGESGTGKELLARVIHRNSDRAEQSLICVNCAALAPSLLESELFGHVKGAFTGAHADKQGRFQAAHGGTLFLDEIGDISAEIQVKLLRVLQERQFEPVGSDHTVEVDVRLIAATNRNLEELIAASTFREDLFYRLNVVSLMLPALRERHGDLAELVFFFLSRSARQMKKQIRQIAPAAMEALESYSWPGNIRELENVIERAVVLADSDMITPEDLPAAIRNRPEVRVQPGRPAASSGTAAVRSVARKQSGQEHGQSRPARSQQGKKAAWLTEEQELRDALLAADGNKAVAARSLNLPRSTFYSRCRKYGIR